MTASLSIDGTDVGGSKRVTVKKNGAVLAEFIVEAREDANGNVDATITRVEVDSEGNITARKGTVGLNA